MGRIADSKGRLRLTVLQANEEERFWSLARKKRYPMHTFQCVESIALSPLQSGTDKEERGGPHKPCKRETSEILISRSLEIEILHFEDLAMQATGNLVGNHDHIVFGYLGQIYQSPAAAGTLHYTKFICHERRPSRISPTGIEHPEISTECMYVSETARMDICRLHKCIR